MKLLHCCLLYLATLVLMGGAARPARAHSTEQVLTAGQASQDVKILERALTELHPALTKYRSQAEIDAAFSQFEKRGQAARTSGEMYLAATELAAAIRCGHTWTNVLNQEGGSKTTLFGTSDKLPFTMVLVANRWLVLRSADPSVSPGDEILAINGKPAEIIVASMKPYLRADGSSDGKRLRQLNHNRGDYSQMDIVWPLLSPPADGRYQLQVRKPSGDRLEVSVRAVTLAAREAALASQGVRRPSEAWTFRIDGDTGILTLPTFAFWNSDFDWAAFIDAAFAELFADNVPNLIVDIRANEGGDGAIGGRILSHLISRPFEFTSDQSTSSYERVPYDLARYLNTWDFSFFDRTGKVEKITTGTAAGKYRYLPNSRGKQTIMPQAPLYRGKTFVLVSSENSSATFQFALLAKQSGAATLVGQTTGGNQRGLNGGQLAWLVLPNSGVSVDIPLLAATYSTDTPDASVEPDVAVTPSFDALAEGRDMEMEAIAELMN